MRPLSLALVLACSASPQTTRDVPATGSAPKAVGSGMGAGPSAPQDVVDAAANRRMSTDSVELVRSWSCNRELPAADDVREAEVSFRGWLGEAAILRQKYKMNDDRRDDFYFAGTADGVQTQICHPEHPRDPRDLASGRVIFDKKPSGKPKLELAVSLNKKQRKALDRAIEKWQEDSPPLPTAAAKLTLRRDSEVIWTKSMELQAGWGEYGLPLFSPPALRRAELSRSEETILIEISLNDGNEIEYLILPNE